MMMKKRLMGALALGTTALIALAGCSGDGTGGTGGTSTPENGGSETTETAGSLEIGYIAGWTDGQSLAYLLKDQFEKMGYEIDITDLTDNGPMYAALSQGDLDINASAWPEVTHASYMKEFGDTIEDLGTWYDGAVLTIAVPEYSQINSLEELADNVDVFDGEIIGIEPGAGLTEVTQTSMMQAYGLEDSYTLRTSSTATMLTLLGEAIDNEEEIVVTLWRPFWANSAYPVRDLADPLGAMGEPEGLHVLGRDGFAADFPELAEFIAQLKLDDDEYGALESLVTSEEFEGDTEGAVDAWIADHADAFPGLLTE